MTVADDTAMPAADDTATAADDTATPAAGSPSWRIVSVASVHVELPDQFPVVTLRETETAQRQLSFRIGLAEGVALRHALDGTRAARPLTHDLFAAALRRLGAEVTAVRLTARRGTVYAAELELMTARGREVLECRPSDGLALAMRAAVPAPVLVDERLFSPGDVG